MSMTRANAHTYLSTQLASALTEVGADLVSPTSLDVVIDDALLMVGTAASDLATAEVADSKVFGYRRVLRYVGLQYVYDQALTRVDISIADPDVRKSRSQFTAALKDALEYARQQAEPFLMVDPTFQTGSIAYGPSVCTDEYSRWA